MILRGSRVRLVPSEFYGLGIESAINLPLRQRGCGQFLLGNKLRPNHSNHGFYYLVLSLHNHLQYLSLFLHVVVHQFGQLFAFLRPSPRLS